MNAPLFLALDLPGDGLTAPDRLRSLVADAERAGVALVTFADRPHPGPGPAVTAGSIEAGARAAFVTTSTDRVGLAPELHVTTTEPFHLATQLASLDHASRGRGAWLVGAANGALALATVGAAGLTPEAWHREVTDVIDVVRDLWDSWQDDAVIRDVATGRYLDPARVHHVDFQGARFGVKGPLITPRPPQGQLVVIAPWHLDVADRADVVLLEEIVGVDVGGRADRARRSGAPLVVTDVTLAGADDSGSALVDRLRALAGKVDGVRLHLPDLDRDLPVLFGTGLPALAAAGLLRRPEPGRTLRSNLGLPRPANRFAAAATTTDRG